MYCTVQYYDTNKKVLNRVVLILKMAEMLQFELTLKCLH